MKINNIERVAHDLVILEDMALLRRSLDGQWQQNMHDREYGQYWMDLSSDCPSVIELEAQYQQEKEPSKPSMGQMTEEHIVALAKHELSLSDNEIVHIEAGDGWIRLEWKDIYSTGTIFVNGDMVTFSSDDNRSRRNASVHTLRHIVSWGYDVMKDGTCS